MAENKNISSIPEHEEMGKRLVKLRSMLGFPSQKDFALETGISQSSLSATESGYRLISTNTLLIIMDKFPQVNPTWILTGKGDIFLGTEKIINGDHNVVQIAPHSQNNSFSQNNTISQNKICEGCRKLELEIAGLKAQVSLLKELLEKR